MQMTLLWHMTFVLMTTKTAKELSKYEQSSEMYCRDTHSYYLLFCTWNPRISIVYYILFLFPLIMQQIWHGDLRQQKIMIFDTLSARKVVFSPERAR